MANRNDRISKIRISLKHLEAKSKEADARILSEAEQLIHDLSSPTPLSAGWQPISTADKDQERLTLGIFRSRKLEEIHVGGYRHAYNDDEESCWWSDQCDDEIVPTHWMPDLSALPAASAEVDG